MCARFTLFTPGNLIAERFLLAQIPALIARYNIAPSQALPIIAAKANGTGRGLAMFRWGFIPHWATDEKGMRPVNAKSETIAGSVMFGNSFRGRRCIVPADGFYEWRTEGKKKLPVHFRLKDRSPFAFAGVWDIWKLSRRGCVQLCDLDYEAERADGYGPRPDASDTCPRGRSWMARSHCERSRATPADAAVIPRG